jgi:acetoin utilization deacetylase AcuC-like enzyme
MHKNILFTFLLALIVCNLKAQLVYKDVAGIFYARCTSCHHVGASNYPFMDYAKTKIMVNSIQNDLNINRMPPWSADTTYSRFQHERIITASEKAKILSWIKTE